MIQFEAKEMSTTTAGMDADIFEQFTEQLHRYVRERLIPAEKQVLETDLIPDDILDEMRQLGLFAGGVWRGWYEHPAICSHHPGTQLCDALLSVDHVDQHWHGLFRFEKWRHG
jgi:hypothetical protein